MTASFFDVVGARARLGRTFRPEETEPTTTQPVTVISHGLGRGAWRRSRHPRPGPSTCQPRTVIGARPEFEWAAPPSTAGSWGRRSGCPWPTSPTRTVARGQTELLVAARMKPHTTVAAQADLSLVARRLEQAYPTRTRAARCWSCPCTSSSSPACAPPCSSCSARSGSSCSSPARTSRTSSSRARVPSGSASWPCAARWGTPRLRRSS